MKPAFTLPLRPHLFPQPAGWLLMCCLMAPVMLQATHYLGVDITYECLPNGCHYRIYHTSYYDCSGSAMQPFFPLMPNDPPPPPTAASFSFGGVPNTPGQVCSAPTPVNNAPWSFISYAEVTPVCPSATTRCTDISSPIRGVSEVRYFRDYNFCNTTCDVYNIRWEECCRNNAITSLNQPGLQSMAIATTQINTTLAPCNNSPQFSNIPAPYICAGQPYTFNQGATDPDGDSLVYSLGSCYEDAGPGTPLFVPYLPGYSATAPLGPGWSVAINALNGDITITPNPGGPIEVGVLCVYVTEYRNGVQIGQVSRDVQVTVIDCAALGQVNNLPSITGLTNLSPGATANGLTVNACACSELSFDILTADIDPNQNFVLAWDQGVPGELANALTPTVAQDTITSAGAPPSAHFSWVPTQTGVYSFTLTLQDDGCPLLGQTQQSITINVNGCALPPFLLETRLDCYDVRLEALACGAAPPLTYQWSGPGGLNSNAPVVVHAYPGPGTYPYTVTITDANGFVTTNSGSLSLANAALADAGPDLYLCSGDIGTIGTPALPGYTYTWTSPLGQGWAGTINPATAQANVVLNNGTAIPFIIPFYLQATDPIGCVAYDTVQVTFAPEPQAAVISPAQACTGEAIPVSYGGPSVPGSLFFWDFGGGTGTANGPGPHLVSWSTPGPKTVRLVVESNGCQSDTAFRTVTVNPIPTSGFSVTPQVCAGQAAQAIYTGSADPNTATFTWDFGGGQGAGGGTPFGIVWTTPGIKTVTLTVTENGCISSTSVQTVTVFPVPTASFAVQPQICEDDVMQITYTGSAAASATYIWSFGPGAQVLGGSGQGPYQVRWATGGIRDV
ncbi:MAG: PKD domain-containing protein, partial [Bacteroidia bacterium]|nr:PKD domain-containing protein [Bacteroidia bacterium]